MSQLITLAVIESISLEAEEIMQVKGMQLANFQRQHTNTATRVQSFGHYYMTMGNAISDFLQFPRLHAQGE